MKRYLPSLGDWNFHLLLVDLTHSAISNETGVKKKPRDEDQQNHTSRVKT